MSVSALRYEDQGDGNVTVYAVTPLHNTVHATMPYTQKDTAAMYLMLEIAASKADRATKALNAARYNDIREG